MKKNSLLERMDFDKVKSIFLYLFLIFYVFLTVYSTKFVQGSVLLALTVFGLGFIGFEFFTKKKKFEKKVIYELICYFVCILYALYLFGIITLP
ncbi:hypothetical protein JOE23_001911 [Amphibacillus cookii]|nr:hypothetical protein [Amphibacillus cookii]